MEEICRWGLGTNIFHAVRTVFWAVLFAGWYSRAIAIAFIRAPSQVDPVDIYPPSIWYCVPDVYKVDIDPDCK